MALTKKERPNIWGKSRCGSQHKNFPVTYDVLLKKVWQEKLALPCASLLPNFKKKKNLVYQGACIAGIAQIQSSVGAPNASAGLPHEPACQFTDITCK